MKRKMLLALLGLTAALGVRGGDFVAEAEMQDGLLQMLASFAQYMKNDYQPCSEPDALGQACGCFRSNSTMTSGEDGVRPNADMSMVCAFLCRYGRGRVALPQGVGWDDLALMARRSLVYACATHKANRLKTCADGRHWGSTGRQDHVWESSLWAMSVAFSAAFQWDSLTDSQRQCVRRLLRAECQYELERDIPTGFRGDTKAEENGWEADVLAATLGLFPHDELAPQWRRRMVDFALNSYSHPADAGDTTATAPDGRRVCDVYRGPNLYPDYTLQNHRYFHTSYQNVVIQELGEAVVALALGGRTSQAPQSRPPETDALLHNCRQVCDSVLWWLALSDGELAMPNGNDWSLFLYDQLTSYSTMACLLRDADALMLENRAYQMIRHRQQTTPDGSWLLRPDIGARRMGVQAHRVMMTWLMHHLWPTGGLAPTTWDDFRRRHAQARLLPCQKVVRASTGTHFTCFSWSEGLQSYTGYMAPHLEPGQSGGKAPSAVFDPRLSNLVVPFKAHNTGNLLGWYEVEGRRTNAVPAGEPRMHCQGGTWRVDGHLLANDSALDIRFSIATDDGNAVVYIDTVRARANCTVLCEKGGLLAISEDELTATHRRYTFGPGYVNIDNRFGIVNRGGKMMKVEEPRNVNSVMTALLYASYDDRPRHYQRGDVVDCRRIVFYTGVTAEETARLAH